MTPEQFYAQYLPYAQSVSQRTGLDPRLVLAQSALETGYGKSAPNMNFFGIKSHGRKGGSTLGTQEFEGGRMVQQPASFRGYETPEQSFTDYADFITSNPRYKGVLEADGLEAQIAAMAKSGYATDPDYGSKLASIASRFDPNSPRVIAAETMGLLGKGPQTATTGTQGAAPMMQAQMPREEAPKGILEMLGVQRRDPTAQGQGALPFYQRDRFADTMGALATGFNQLRLRPDENLEQSVMAGREGRRQKAMANKTAEWLAQQPGSGAFVQMLSSGADPAKVLQAYQAAQANAAKTAQGSIQEVDGRLVRVMPDGSVTEVYAPQKTVDPDAIQSARKEFTALPQVKAFGDQTSAYGRIISSIEDPSPAGDLALIFNYMKVLDPGSVVREGEFATAQNAGSIDDRTRGIYNRIVSGERLSEAQRADFADRATKLYSGAERQYRDVATQYSDFARAAGLPPEQVIPDFEFSGQLYQKPLALTPPPPPSGIAPEDWTKAWSEMTDQERQQFMGEVQ